jgi:hypothetical protein
MGCEEQSILRRQKLLSKENASFLFPNNRFSSFHCKIAHNSVGYGEKIMELLALNI